MIQNTAIPFSLKFSNFIYVLFREKYIYFLELDPEGICRRMVLVCGTSTCHMAISRDKLFIPGVWGPFWSGMR